MRSTVLLGYCKWLNYIKIEHIHHINNAPQKPPEKSISCHFYFHVALLAINFQTQHSRSLTSSFQQLLVHISLDSNSIQSNTYFPRTSLEVNRLRKKERDHLPCRKLNSSIIHRIENKYSINGTGNDAQPEEKGLVPSYRTFGAR